MSKSMSIFSTCTIFAAFVQSFGITGKSNRAIAPLTILITCSLSCGGAAKLSSPNCQTTSIPDALKAFLSLSCLFQVLCLSASRHALSHQAVCQYLHRKFFTVIALCPGTFAVVFGGLSPFFSGIRTQGSLCFHAPREVGDPGPGAPT